MCGAPLSDWSLGLLMRSAKGHTHSGSFNGACEIGRPAGRLVGGAIQTAEFGWHSFTWIRTTIIWAARAIWKRQYSSALLSRTSSGVGCKRMAALGERFNGGLLLAGSPLTSGRAGWMLGLRSHCSDRRWQPQQCRAQVAAIGPRSSALAVCAPFDLCRYSCWPRLTA